MKVKNIAFIALALGAMVATSCKTTYTEIPNEYAFATFETECLGTELDGSQTLRSWGKGKDKADAIEQAKKNAVRDVIFKGINAGSGECSKKPLILEVNAQEKYEYYFNAFFKDGGAYKKYVTAEDENKTSRMRAEHSTQDNYGVLVRVKRAELRQRLIDDNILKP